MTKDSLPSHIVFRRVHSGDGEALVFATPVRVELVDRWQRAVDESTTWGQFRLAIGPVEAERIDQAGFDDAGEPRPADTEPFDYQQIPGYEDGDWPPWLAAEMDMVLPRSVLERFGERCQSVLNGSFWTISAHLEQAVLRALEIEGIAVQRRDDLNFH